MVTVGLAFKLSAVPFHFWAPDVFEGATAEVAAFLSVASKAAALGLLVRLVAVFSLPSALTFPEGISLPADRFVAVAALSTVRQFIVAMLALLAAVTCTFGNLAAYGQTNMKRLLAYSTIAHAGYMMMPVAAAAALAGSDPDGARQAVAALLVYLGIYLFMNLAAFAVVAFLRNATGSEEIADYAGLVRRSPGLTVCMAIVMFSLVGLPPLAGFPAKMTVFISLIDAKLWVLLFIGALNTRAQPVLLSPRGEGDGHVARAAAPRGPDDPLDLRGRILLCLADRSGSGVVFPPGRDARLGRDCRLVAVQLRSAVK